MKNYKPSDVRVVGFFGHRGSGKTSLIEMMLFDSKATTRLGSVEAGNLALELDEGALERQTTMHANAGFCEWDGVRIGIVDTPGDGNFWGSTNRALAVVDSAVITVSATDGVENMTLRTVEKLNERKVPFAVFVTKLDKDVSDPDGVLKEIGDELKKEAVLLTLPIGKGADFKGIVSLLSQKAYLANGEEADVPADMVDAVESARENLFDAVAAADDDLAEKYLEEGTLSEDQLNQGLRAAFTHGDLAPILVGAPTSDLGARPLLNLIRAVYPAPTDRPAIKGYKSDKAEQPVERIPSADGPLVAQVFRTFNDPYAGVLSFARVWSGTMGSSDVFNSTKRMNDRPSHLYVPMGGTKDGAEIKEAHAGDIIVITKLKSTKTSDTLTSKDDPTFLPPFDEPEALLNFSLSAAEQKEEDKVSSFVRKVCDEDPSLRFERDSETKEMLLGGLGQAHIDYVVDRLTRANLKVVLHEPKVPYRETIRGKVDAVEGKHKKQTGGSGQFGVCLINVEPLPRGSGIEFVDAIVGGAIPRNYIPSVEKGIRDLLSRGPLSGNEVVDLKVTLYDGKYHRVDSSDMAFQAAGRKAIRALYDSPRCKPILLEPYMHIDVACPADSVGDVMGDLNSRRARVEDMTTEGRRGKISASVPMNEILKYTNVLKSLTSGRGSFTMRFARYEEAPANIREQVQAAYGAAKEED